MKFVYIALIVIVTIVVLLFKFPDIEVVNVSFLSLTGSMPVAVLVFLIYLLGIVAGGALLGLLRIRRAAPKRQ